ncbi:MAG: SDR family oxidoreductase [Acidobacteria bacterium]|nr:SDR family oxidoreductase [Acidobacteriota bacterium]MBI3421468.1 SDR family oxidoreductase [Acidobacteriota bacterium]
MQTVLVAGATGQLGRCVVHELKQQGHRVRVLARNPANIEADETKQADLTKPETLDGACAGVDAIISCAGAAMTMGGFGNRQSFYQVDWQGNVNLLTEAQRQRVPKFVYVSLAHANTIRQVEYADAHARFAEALQASGLPHTVVSPTGFFGFMLEILKYAKQGRGVLIGDGSCRTNPIHEADVARACVEALTSNEREMLVGGPEVFTRKEITELAFDVLGRPPKLMKVPPGLFKALITPLKLINPRLHALMDFGVAVTQVDCVAPAYGQQRLRDYFNAALPSL